MDAAAVRELRGRLVEHLTEEWLAAHLGVPGVELHRDPDATWIVQPGSAWGNAAAQLRFSADSVEGRLDTTGERYRRNRRGGGFRVSPYVMPADLPDRLRRRAFRCRKCFPGMHCDFFRAEAIRLRAGLEFTVVADVAVFAETPWGHPCHGRITTAFRRFAMLSMAHVIAPRPRRVWQLAMLLEGRPAAAFALQVHERGAGLWNIGVAEPFRRAGIGSALVARTCAFAREQGAAEAILIAGGMGYNVYRRVGFVEVCPWDSPTPR